VDLKQFDYQLPADLIAQQPLTERTTSRLLHVVAQKTSFNNLQFSNLKDLLRRDDVLVLNDTKVIPARMFGKKASGGKIEFLLERILDAQTVLAQLKSSKSPKSGTAIYFADNVKATVQGRQNDFYQLTFDDVQDVLSVLEVHGSMPLPPYIQRLPEHNDNQRYQTVYAKHQGAVAAPTAGLHFDNQLLTDLQQCGVTIVNITLHVGAGTFQPVREEKITAHQIHAEKAVCEQVNACKKRGGRVIAVGTTVARALESAALSGVLEPFENDTSLFIYPGFKFNVIDALITNFHLPKSTLLMLVSAFAGYVMAAYEHAVKEKYRFYSYGDAMFIEGVLT